MEHDEFTPELARPVTESAEIIAMRDEIKKLRYALEGIARNLRTAGPDPIWKIKVTRLFALEALDKDDNDGTG